MNLSAGGSLANPQFGGTANIANGRYENQATGTVIVLPGAKTEMSVGQFEFR